MNNLLKLQFFVLVSLFVATGRLAKADDTIFRYLHVVEQDKSETVYALSRNTKVNLTSDSLRVNFGDFSMLHALPDVVKIYYEKKIVPTDVNVSTKQAISIHQIPDNATIFVYTINGKLLFSHRNVNSTVRTAIQSLKSGVYLMKIDGISYKYLKP